MKGFFHKRSVLLLILAFLLALSVLSLIRAIKTINEFRHQEPIPYDVVEGRVTVALPSGSPAILSFGKKYVSVEPSAGTTHKDASFLAAFIKGYAEKEGIPITVTATSLIGEYRLHTLLSDMGYRRGRTEKADLEYQGDARWYVNLCSRMIGFLGI